VNPDTPTPGYSEFDRGATPKPPESPRQVPVKLPSISPTITYGILIFTVLVFIAQEGSRTLLGIDIPSQLGLKVNSLIAQGQIWRLFTPMLLHGSLLHIGFNMYALYLLGPGMERYFGHWRFFILYVLSGFAGNVASFMFSAAPSLGSSTAIFGLLGAEGVFLYQNRGVLGNFARRALNNIIFVAAINLLIGLSPGIDNWGHLGGLIGGSLFAAIGGPILSVEGIFPNLNLTDKRETREVVIASLSVSALFIILTTTTLYLRP
jgi:rhomboid protease GluP